MIDESYSLTPSVTILSWKIPGDEETDLRQQPQTRRGLDLLELGRVMCIY